MFTIILRIFHFGFKNFWRNGWLTMITVIIMTLALFVFAWLIFFGVVTSRAAASIEDKIDISVYFNTNTSEDEILSIQQSLEGLPQVQSVDYISQDQALTTFKQNHSQDTTITQAVNELDANPLEASLNIKAKNPSQYADIASYLNSGDLSQYIDSVSYTENQSVIDRLARIVRTVEVGGVAVMIVFALLAGLVVFNTIRLAIYANREEIGVMRVVGASNALVRGPFVVEGMLCGAIAAFLALVVSVPILFAIDPYLNVFIPGMNLFQYFLSHLVRLLIYLLAFGIALGGLSSFFAVKRYLKN